MSARVLIWVQHLLGFGHFARARALSEALRDAGFEVALVSGGVTPADAVPAGVRFVQLSPARAKDELFDELVDEAGRAVDAAWHNMRRDQLLAALHAAKPDAVVTETFPFGRRLLDFEMSALLDEVARASPRPKLITSVRDVLQRPRKDGRAVAMVARARAHYDAILVHGDPNVARLEQSFPETTALADLCRYTGYICADIPSPDSEREEILISAGGGAAGRQLIEAALGARMHSRLKARPWTVVTGPLTEAVPAAVAGVTIVRSLPDFRARLAAAAVSVSQAGYNTLIEVVKARTAAIAVPFETDREKEQLMRAELFAARGLVTLIRGGELGARALATAIDAVADTTPPPAAIDFEGRSGSVAAMRAILRHG